MNKTFFIFRHGETDWNRDRRLQGAVDIPLNDNGRKQALHLQDFFRRHPVDIFLSSDLIRARETAEIAVGISGKSILVEPRLREMNLGDAEGLMITEVADRYGGDTWKKWAELGVDDVPCFPNGESKHQHLWRLMKGLTDFVTSPQAEAYARVGVATHGGSMRRLIHHLAPHLTQPAEITNCIVYEFTFDTTTARWAVDENPRSIPL